MSARNIVLMMIGCAVLLHGETVRLPHRAAAQGKPTAAGKLHAPAKLAEAPKLPVPAPAVPPRRKIGLATGARGAFPARSFRSTRASLPSTVLLPSRPTATGLPHRGPYAAVLGGAASDRAATAGLLSGNRMKHKF